MNSLTVYVIANTEGGRVGFLGPVLEERIAQSSHIFQRKITFFVPGTTATKE